MPHAAPVERPQPGRVPPAPVVALAAWAVPGAGYWLIGERARGILVGVTIVSLFAAGLLIGGVRVLQVPGYGEDGGRVYTWYLLNDDGRPTRGIMASEHQPPRSTMGDSAQGPWVATETRALLGEVGAKPWSICQVMTGPVALAAGAWSVQASRAADGGEPAGVLSHSRINEIAVLYTAVAGMLNLLVILDASARAGRHADALPHPSAPRAGRSPASATGEAG
jgi:hypothetical protein